MRQDSGCILTLASISTRLFVPGPRYLSITRLLFMPRSLSPSGRIFALLFAFLVLVALLLYHNPLAVELPHVSSNKDSSETPEHKLNEPEETPIAQKPAVNSESHHDADARCEASPDPGNIAIAVKTGATEAVEKVPILMLTTLRCAQNVQLFSDFEQDIAGYHVTDALRSIPASAMRGNSDFDFYRKLKEAARLGEISNMLRGIKDPRTPTDLAAWTLDKYKFLHVLEELYETYPEKDWYLMIDADTYIVWSNLVTWLGQLPDPKTNKLYLGSPAQVIDRQFAHGGSGIIMSRAAMLEFAVKNKGIAATWDKKMHDECCGDLIIGDVLREEGIRLSGSWPSINGENPHTLPFGPSHWCQPVVTMHHAQPNDMNHIANFEIRRNQTLGPLTFADLYDAFVKDALPDQMIDWDNYPKDTYVELDSYEACGNACEEDSECFQFNHHGTDCMLGYSIHIGQPKASTDDQVWRSGWLKDRIKEWVDKQEPCQPKFPHVA